jgi:hypothetical protein
VQKDIYPRADQTRKEEDFLFLYPPHVSANKKRRGQKIFIAARDAEVLVNSLFRLEYLIVPSFFQNY